MFDAALDKRLSKVRITPNGGTIRGDGTVPGSPFVGPLAPFIVMVREWVNHKLDGGGALSDRQRLTILFNGLLTYFTNESGVGLQIHFPAAIRRRASQLVAHLTLPPPGQGFSDVAEELAKQWEEGLKPVSNFIQKVAEKWVGGRVRGDN